MTNQLKQYLEDNGLELKCPTRKALREYVRQEAALLKTMSKAEDDADAAVEAQNELGNLQDSFVSKAYPGVDVGEMPADIFRDLLVEMVAKGQGNVRGN